MEEKIRLETGEPQERHAAPAHEAGHAVAACSIGFGMTRRGIVLRGREGIAHTRGPGLHSRNPKMRERYNRGTVVVAFAGPVAEYRVNPGLVRIDCDVEHIAYALRELLPCKKQFVEGVLGYGKYWGDFWALVYTLATSTEREGALAELDDFPGLAKIDVSIFEMLWPFAQRAHAIIDLYWSSVEDISCHLLKVGSISGDEIEALVGM